MSARLPPPRCAECAGRDELVLLQARAIDGDALTIVSLCGSCLRDRAATWRTRWSVRGRSLPPREDTGTQT